MSSIESLSHASATPSPKQSFDFDWKFVFADQPEAATAEFDDARWRSLDLPHDWSIEGKFDPGHPMGGDGGYLPAGIGWYRKHFHVPADWEGKRIALYFEGVYMNAEVFLNGASLGTHPYGYTSFFQELSSTIRYGEENVIAVKVDNSGQPNCRWYTGSGIYRHVWLTVTEPVHLDPWGIAITTPVANAASATVQVESLVKNDTREAQPLTVSVEIVDPTHNTHVSTQLEVEILGRDEKVVKQTIELQHPMLWSPESPSLYTATISLFRNGELVDRLEQTFGVRSIQFSVENGFQLNGKTVILNGGCVHHDHGCLGAAAYDRAEERKVELLKAAGFNAVRTSHNPPSEAFLDACDRLGLLVMDEIFDGWRSGKKPYDYAQYFDAHWRGDVESMVLRDRNHPSVIMWSIGNEINERTKLEGVRTAQMLRDYVHQLDSTRPVTSAITIWGEQVWESVDPLFAAHDIGGYNYQLHYAESDHERIPSRIIVNTESYPANAFNIWDRVQSHPYILGDFVWTAIDYLGESGIGRYYYPGEPEGQHWEGDFYPWHGAYCGDIDLTGWRKPISHYRSMLYNQQDKLYMAVREPNPDNGEIKLTSWAVWPTWESWNWPGYEGKPIEVEVYSMYPSVRLYLNDRLIGEQSTSKADEFKTIFRVPYQPGILKAVGIDGGQERESRVLQTAGEATRLKLTVDRSRIRADGQDLAYVTIEVVDSEDRLQPNAADLIQFSIDGPGTIVGVGNGNLKNEEPYVAASRHAWHGRALVVIRSDRTPGDIRLTASSTGFPDSIITIRVE